MLISKFLSPKNDYAFKQIFGKEKNQAILIHFINDILNFQGPDAIQTVKFLNPNQHPDIAFRKQSLIDVLCEDQQGRQHIIEMQVAKTKGFEKRAQYYAARAYSQQLNQSNEYEQLKGVIFIAITDFVMFPDKSNYYSTHWILDNQSYSYGLKDFSFTFLELPKFHKQSHELTTTLEKWMYFFKHAEHTGEAESIEVAGQDTIILQAYEALNRFNWSDNELKIYEQETKRDRDARAIVAQQVSDAEARGETRGEARGEARGIDKTIEVIKLLNKGLSLSEIAVQIGVTEEAVTAIANKLLS